MGTRGAYGFRYRWSDRVTYNHYDSYPEELGESLVYELLGFFSQRGGYQEGLDEIKEMVESIELMPEDAGDEVYHELRHSMGSINRFLYQEDLRMLDCHTFLADSLFCEWAYIVNLDDETFEVYKGFNKIAEAEGRYAVAAPNERGFFGVALVKAWPLMDILGETDRVLEEIHALDR